MHKKLVKMLQFTFLLVIVILLQLFLAQIKIGPTGFSVVLVPIVIGACVLGPWYGAGLGFAFGVVVLFSDQFALTLFEYSPFSTIFLCLIKGAAAGLAAGYVFRLFKDKNQIVASFLSAATAPIVNSGLFVLLMYLLMLPALRKILGEGSDVTYFLFITCTGLNFIIELLVNMILAPVIYQVWKTVTKSRY